MKTALRIIVVAVIVLADFLGFLSKDTLPQPEDD